MSNLSIKDVPDAWAEALRERAKRNHRSLQGELMAILERALAEPASGFAAVPGALVWPVSVPPRVAEAAPGGAGGPMRQGWKSVEQVASELRAQYPEPIAEQRSSIELIREDRDAR